MQLVKTGRIAGCRDALGLVMDQHHLAHQRPTLAQRDPAQQVNTGRADLALEAAVGIGLRELAHIHIRSRHAPVLGKPVTDTQLAQTVAVIGIAGLGPDNGAGRDAGAADGEAYEGAGGEMRAGFGLGLQRHGGKHAEAGNERKKRFHETVSLQRC